ncbi:MAG: NADH:flavin oxidoreductase [Candidatus Margulisiibacteriota bacterium]|jgi:2,4-dienoyl-CoA reductase-like NADH-dependent reductase (Old Yellow Enzyme family)
MIEEMFTPFKIKSLTLPNRFIMSAANDNLSHDPLAEIKRFQTLIQGGVGLIFSGGLRITVLDGWDKIAAATHEIGGKLAIQIVSDKGVYKSDIAVSVLNEDNPFFNEFFPYHDHREATNDEIWEIIDTYAKAAEKVQALGVDAVAIHAAHASVPMQFLSPLTNLRTDQWGGSIENRTRFHREIIKAIRTKVGDNFPVFIKLGVEDPFENGLKFSEGKIAAQLIAEAGYDALEISQGLMDLHGYSGSPMRINIKTTQDEAYFGHWCSEIKKIISKPTIMTGGIRSFVVAKEKLANKETDLIGICRPFIREPNLVKRWQSGDLRKATCISCNKCVEEFTVKGLPLACFLDKKIKV